MRRRNAEKTANNWCKDLDFLTTMRLDMKKLRVIQSIISKMLVLLI